MSRTREFKELNRSELHTLFNCDISEFIFDYNEKPSEEERRMAVIAEERLRIISLKHFPRVSFPGKINTPDFASVVDMVVIEIKTVGSMKNGFNNAFKRAKRRFRMMNRCALKIVILDVDRIVGQEDIENIVMKARERARAHNISRFLVIKNNRCIYEH